MSPRPQYNLIESNLNQSNIIKDNGAIAPTPKEIAESFFNNNKGEQTAIIDWLIEKGVSSSLAKQELKKFINYWTELTPSGKKQKWQTQPTFEVQRRLATWFSNFDKFSGKNNNQFKGKNYDN